MQPKTLAIGEAGFAKRAFKCTRRRANQRVVHDAIRKRRGTDPASLRLVDREASVTLRLPRFIQQRPLQLDQMIAQPLFPARYSVARPLASSGSPIGSQ